MGLWVQRRRRRKCSFSVLTVKPSGTRIWPSSSVSHISLLLLLLLRVLCSTCYGFLHSLHSVGWSLHISPALYAGKQLELTQHSDPILTQICSNSIFFLICLRRNMKRVLIRFRIDFKLCLSLWIGIVKADEKPLNSPSALFTPTENLFFLRRGNINSSCDSDNEGEKRVFPAHNWEECSSSPRTAALLLVSRCLMTISRVCVFIYATVNHYYTIYWGFLKGLTHTHTLFFFFLFLRSSKDVTTMRVGHLLLSDCERAAVAVASYAVLTQNRLSLGWSIKKKRGKKERRNGNDLPRCYVRCCF